MARGLGWRTRERVVARMRDRWAIPAWMLDLCTGGVVRLIVDELGMELRANPGVCGG
jgi:uncharacterized membrane protein YozB (DUF420 family)